MTEAATSKLGVQIATGDAARDLLALEKGLKGAASGVALLGREIQNHSGNIQRVLGEFSKYGFGGLSQSLSNETKQVGAGMRQLEREIEASAKQSGKKAGQGLATGMQQEIKVGLAAAEAEVAGSTSRMAIAARELSQLSGVNPKSSITGLPAKGTLLADMLRNEAATAKVIEAEMVSDFKTAVAALTSTSGAAAAKGTVLADMLRRDASAAKVIEAEMVSDFKAAVAALTSTSGAASAKGTVLADMLRRDASAAKVIEAEMVSDFKTAVAALTSTSGAAAAKGTVLADMLRRDSAEMDAYVAKVTATARSRELLMGKSNLQAAISTRTGAGLGTSGMTQQYSEGVSAFGQVDAMNKLKGATNESTQATKAWSAAQKDAHDTVRGLSGALGGLWMTYGQLIPLMAGFAAAATLKGAFTASKDFAYQMAFVGAVTGDTAEQMDKVSASLVNMSKSSMFKPTEMAGGMRILAQAGMSSAEALSTLPSVMALATVGETDLATAAETATGIMHAFGLEVTDIGHIGDVIAKAAAISITSVESMSQSMKQASTVAQQYDLSLSTVSAALVALAERNIKGQAAGTAFRNMMNELSTPTDRGRMALDKLGVSLYDSHGNTKNLTVVMDELRAAMSKFDKQSQNLLGSTIFGERGNKPFQAIMAKTPEEWAAMISKIEDSNGFLTQSMERLQDTVEGRFKNMAANAQASLISIGAESEGPLKDLAGALTDAFTNPNIIAGVKALAAGIVGLTRFVVEHAAALATMAGGYLAFKIASGALLVVATGYVKLAEAVTFLKEAYVLLRTTSLAATAATLLGVGATTAAAAATTTAGAATVGMEAATVGATSAVKALMLAMLANPITAVIVAVGLLAAAYLTLRDNTNGAAKAAEDAHRESQTAIGILEAHTKATEDLIAAKEREMGLRPSKEVEAQSSVVATRDKLTAEIAALSQDKQTQTGQRILASGMYSPLASASPIAVLGRSAQAYAYGEEIAKAKRLNDAKAEEAVLNNKLYTQGVAASKLANLNAQSESVKLTAEAAKPKGTQTVTAEDLKGETGKLGKAIEDAFSVKPIDDFLKTFKERRKQITEEYKKLREDLKGSQSPVEATGLNLSAELSKGRSALAQGDSAGTGVARDRAKGMFKDLAAKPDTTSFEKSYYSRQLEQFEQDVVTAEEKVATDTESKLRQSVSRVMGETHDLKVVVDNTNILAQIKGAMEKAKEDLLANPLVIPITVVPSISPTGNVSVDVSDSARKFGKR